MGWAEAVVVICFQISIFEPLETTKCQFLRNLETLWFAFKLVSLNHWKQHCDAYYMLTAVVICFQISIFEPLETTKPTILRRTRTLWFAFKLVSLNHWKQPPIPAGVIASVVICFQISIFEPLETTSDCIRGFADMLWFAFKLVSLNHWKQRNRKKANNNTGCDLLSN